MSGRRPQSAQPRAATMNELPPFSFLVQALFWRLLDLALTPFRIAYALALGFLGATGPPTFHIVLLFSLVPLIAVWSLGAGLVVRSWIPTGWKQTVYLQYGTGSAPWAEFAVPTLAAGQVYDIALELVMPLHAKNTELGNFMTSLAISTPTNITLSSTSRPSLIFPHPLSSSFIFSPLIYSGVIPTHTVLVPLIDRFSASSYLSSLKGRVEVGRADNWTGLGKGEGKELVVVSAIIRGLPRLSGIRGFFMQHSLLLLLLTSLSFFISTSLIAILAYLYFAPSIRFSPSPLREPPRYGDIGTSKAWDAGRAIKDEDDGGGEEMGLRMIKEEDTESELGSGSGVMFASPPQTQSQSVTGTTESTPTGSESFVTGEDDDDLTETGEHGSEGSESGSDDAVDLGASTPTRSPLVRAA